MAVETILSRTANVGARYLNDAYLLAAVQILLTGLCVVGLWKDLRPLARLWRKIRRPRSEAHGVVTRGPESRKKFHFAYGFASVILLQVINSAEAGRNYKVIISITDLGMLLYLLYYNGWMRNKILGIALRWEQRPERPF